MGPRTLQLKVGLYLAIAVTIALLAFTLLVVRQQREQLEREAASRVTQLSEMITRSTRFAMLLNQPEHVHQIIKAVGSHRSIDRIRIFSKEGRIIDSTYPQEIGLTVDRTAEGCVACHRSGEPAEQFSGADRVRIFPAPGGARLLGSMEVIRNEPSCSNASCHWHSSEQSVLGVLDIVYSLDEIDRGMRRNAAVIGVLALGLGVVALLAIQVLVRRLVYLPLRDLETGARRLSAGDLDQPIPVRSADEFGELAASFNAMTAALRNSREELREWGRTLEEKVEKRTRELKMAEAEAARGEKLASVGLLAAGIAHELNNPLTGILTFSTLIRKKTPDGSPEAEDLDLVIRETRRCATIIRRLLDFAREKTPEKKYCDLNQLVEETARIVERPARVRDIGIALDLGRDLPPAWVDADLVRQVVMNMLVNAQHAIEDKGSITIRTRLASGVAGPVPGAPPVPMIELSIIDTGCGIPEQNLKRIFDPFFTSKEVGKGTGLGLSVSHGIVSAHGGFIQVESRVGEGSTFRVCLPVDPPPGEAGAGGSAP
ncbi:MAG: HAMP domain-containing protein [Steroidobacteraceae bacterium]|nr:HAMP domain-containing protein [Steroidobacteraceae bacterium]